MAKQLSGLRGDSVELPQLKMRAIVISVSEDAFKMFSPRAMETDEGKRFSVCSSNLFGVFQQKHILNKKTFSCDSGEKKEMLSAPV